MPTAPAAPAPGLAALPAAVRTELLAGIADPEPVRLVPPLRLYRFTDRAYGPDAGMVAPWWITENDFLKIVAARERSRRAHGGDGTRALSLGYFARSAAALPQEWQTPGRPPKRTTVDLLLAGDLRVAVDAFAGRGRAQREVAPNGITVTWAGWPDVTQLYIPMLSRRRAGVSLADVQPLLTPGAPAYFVSRPLY